MNKQEAEARIAAIEYIFENSLYSDSMEDEMLQEIKMLREQLKESESSLNESTDDIISSVLKDRGNQYGDFSTFVSNMSKILNILKEHKGEADMKELTEETVENFFIVLKLLRMQTETDGDSLTDIQGYAKLIKDRRYGSN